MQRDGARRPAGIPQLAAQALHTLAKPKFSVWRIRKDREVVIPHRADLWARFEEKVPSERIDGPLEIGRVLVDVHASAPRTCAPQAVSEG